MYKDPAAIGFRLAWYSHLSCRHDRCFITRAALLTNTHSISLCGLGVWAKVFIFERVAWCNRHS